MARLELTAPESKEILPAKVLVPKKAEISPSFPPVQSGSIYVYPTQLIRKDLTKTILLSILAISLELALYFAFEGKIQLPIEFSLPISLSFS